MTFFHDVSPVVNWQQQTVHVRGLKLPVQCFGADVHHVQDTDVYQNKFSVLTVEEGVDTQDCDEVPVRLDATDTECDRNVCQCVGCTRKGSEQLQHLRNASVQSTHATGGSGKCLGLASTCVSGYQIRVAGKGLDAPTRKTTNACTSQCSQCGKRMVHGSVLCKKCANSSFAHLENQLRDSDGDIVLDADQQSADDRNLPAEIVPLSQFTRAGRRGHYLSCGVVMLEQLHNDSALPEQLHFTHRTAHGGDGDKEATHGNMSQLAEQELRRIKRKYPTVFSDPVYPVDRTDTGNVFQHSIPLKDENADPPKRRLYPLDSQELVELKAQIKELLESNRIEPSQGPYGAPILFAKKKDGRLRMCIDYRLLNAQTKNDVFPLPRIDELLSRLDGARIFSKLDLRDGYHQIPMAEGDKEKTAFTCRYGTYQFTVMPFGLMTAPGTFQRMMNEIFFDLLDKGVVIYLDDVLIYSRDIASHRVLLDQVFALLSKHKLYLKDSKCHLYLQRVPFLGHVVDANGVSVE